MSIETTSLDSVLNLDTAMANMDGDAELLQEIMEIFLETADEQLQSIESCIESGDVAEVAIQAHGMKGGASNFCASHFVAAALKLEQVAKTGSLEDAENLLSHMKDTFSELKEVAEVINWDEVARNWSV